MVNYVFCLAHFCEIHGPSTIICTHRHPERSIPPSSSKVQLCASCELILPEQATNLVTTTKNATYLSTNYPSLQKVYTSLMKLVMKSLSVETTADPLKALFFGDVVSGFCLSKIFGIKDVHARGGERKYTLMMVCDSETHLLQSWDVISKYVNEIISLIQKQVEVRLDVLAKSSVGDNERYLRRLKIIPRSLVELTDDEQIFAKFHLWGIEVLRDIE